MIKNFLSSFNFLKISAIFIFLLIFYYIIYQSYSQRFSAFGCFDDCFNYVAGYFINQGKELYSQVFFNHNPLMAYLSAIIQRITMPENVFDLLLQHRRFVFLFSFIFNFFIILRFRLAGVAFVLFYEITKFYVFGDRFLAEAFIVYPLVYMTGITYLKLIKEKIYRIEYPVFGILAWFVIFMREPYTIVTLFVFAFFLLTKEADEKDKGFRLLDFLKNRDKVISLAVFTFLSVLTLLYVPARELFFNVVTVNSQTVFLQESSANRIFGSGAWKIFFYPIYIFFSEQMTILHQILVFLSLIFLPLFGYFLFVKRKLKEMIFVFFALAFSIVRFTEPGRIFYEAFHTINWYGAFLILTFLMLQNFVKEKKEFKPLGYLVVLAFFIYLVWPPKLFIWEKIDQHEEFFSNYSLEIEAGEVVRHLSEPSDTLFLDGWQDLIYWQAKRLSPYEYSWYTSFMPNFEKYNSARLTMFRENPPDFYYGNCDNVHNIRFNLPDFVAGDYERMYSRGEPSCLWIKKSKIPEVSEQQWITADEYTYYLPEEM